jgi:glycerol kinase
MTVECILSVDAGTTGVTVLLVDHDAAVQAQGYREFPQYFPQPGWVEHDAEEIWRAVLAAMADALAMAPDYRPIAIGITNQRETCLFWDRTTGTPLHNAIVWQCRRSAPICEELCATGIEPGLQRRTGLRLDPYFSGTKALWLRRNDASLAARIDAGDVSFGTIDSWLAYRLSGGKVHVTDTTNASRTLCLDLEGLTWDEALLETFGLNSRVMPDVLPPASRFGVTLGVPGLADGVPIAALVGDQQAALYGQACFSAGLTKATYGTGCFILTHTGSTPVFSGEGLITTVAATADGSPAYALEGSIFVAGAALQWLRDNLGLVGSWREGESMAASVEDAAGVVFVPGFVGLGSPFWGPDVRGAILGLTRGTQPAHIVRAALDSMVYQAQDVLSIMGRESPSPIEELRVDGGAAANDALMQLQADLAGLRLTRPASVESTAVGAAYLAGIQAGFWRDEAEVASLRRVEHEFTPGESSKAVAGYERWRTAVEGLLAMKLPPVGTDE